MEEKTSSRILDLTISGRNYSEASPREMNFVGEIKVCEEEKLLFSAASW